MLANKFLDSFSNLTTTHFCDASNNKVRIINPNIHSISKNKLIFGKAFTIKAEGDLLPIIKALDISQKGDVLIIDSGNSQYAMAGEIFSNIAIQKKIAGIIIDGFCRDVEVIKKLSIPFFARGSYPAAGSKNKIGNLNVKIICGGVPINPDDIIFGDENGIIVMTNDEFQNILPLANSIAEKESVAINKVQNGSGISQILNFVKHYECIKNDKNSKLEWI